MTDKMPVQYGVWLPGTGWLKAGQEKKDAIVFDDFDIARQVARRIGSRAQVYYCDRSLVDLEPQFLRAEQERQREKWPIFKMLSAFIRSH
jgi:hypothetical protein